ncbi:MAG: hypothetical protein K6F70_01420 [Eggerthellaceae bacterium]|nr:hypothetical protein [Eggerthellaceae bacterium]
MSDQIEEVTEAASLGEGLSETFANALRPKDDAERFDRLFEEMHAQRTIFFRVMEMCERPCSAASVGAVIDDMQAENVSVFSASNLCQILQEYGGIRKVTENGDEYPEGAVEPNIVEIDGVAYWEPTDPPCVYWQTSDAGLSKVRENHPLERFISRLDGEPDLVPVYQTVLSMAQAENGVSMAELADAIDANPLVAERKPRLYAPRFVNVLEQCEALAWHGAWCITEVGRAGLRECDNRATQTSIQEA